MQPQLVRAPELIAFLEDLPVRASLDIATIRPPSRNPKTNWDDTYLRRYPVIPNVEIANAIRSTTRRSLESPSDDSFYFDLDLAGPWLCATNGWQVTWRSEHDPSHRVRVPPDAAGRPLVWLVPARDGWRNENPFCKRRVTVPADAHFLTEVVHGIALGIGPHRDTTLVAARAVGHAIAGPGATELSQLFARRGANLNVVPTDRMHDAAARANPYHPEPPPELRAAATELLAALGLPASDLWQAYARHQLDAFGSKVRAVRLGQASPAGRIESADALRTVLVELSRRPLEGPGGLVRWKLLLDGATTATLASRAPAIGSTAIAAHLHDECTLVVEITRFAANAPTPLRVQACVGGYIPLHGDSVEFRGADLLKSIPFVELDGGDVHVWISKLPPP